VTKLFGLNIAKVVAQAIGKDLLAATLTTYAPGARNPANLSAGRQPVIYAGEARGYWEDFTPRQVDGERILSDDRKAVLLGGTIKGARPGNKGGPIPQTDDVITMDGVSLRVVRRLSRDPAGATYTFQCRDTRGPDAQ